MSTVYRKNNGGNDALEERKRYVKAFNDTMVSIWKEKITLLKAVRTRSLLDSVVAVKYTFDEKIINITLEQSFLEYGYYVDAGTGKEVSKGNAGDIGRDKVRKAKPWFFRKYTASWLNLRDFLSDNLGRDISDVMTNALSGKVARRFSLK